MDALRTPDDRFANLPGYPSAPHYAEISGMRMHYVDEGPRDGQVVLMLHGEPSWSYLYRKMIPPIAAAGHRAVAPDLFGFGRSDKPVNQDDYTYQFHVDAITAFIEQTDLRGITLVCQDWGGLIGLRVAMEHSGRFARIVAANTFLPTGDPDRSPNEFFHRWREFSQQGDAMPIGQILNLGSHTDLPADVIAAYDAPFPDERYKAGARKFPLLVPIRPDDPASAANRRAWDALAKWNKPFLTAFSDKDAIMAGSDIPLQQIVPGAKGQPHTTIEGGGHFLQEDCGERLAEVVISFMART